MAGIQVDVSKTIWFKCIGCGGMIGFFPEGLPPHHPPGSCGHSKPMNKANVPNSVECALYNQLDAYELWVLHRNLERLPPPNSAEWVRD